MTDCVLLGGIAPLAGSLTLLVADAGAARSWRGEQERAPIDAFHASLVAGTEAPRQQEVRLGDTSAGWLLQLGAMPRDATLFRLGPDRVAVVGPYWERTDGEDVDAAEIRAHVTAEPSPAQRFGAVDVPSGRLVVAHAWGDLSGAPASVSPMVPEAMRAQIQASMAAQAEMRAKVMAEPAAARDRLAALGAAEAEKVRAMLEKLLQNSVDAALARLVVFGGTDAVIRVDTGDRLLVVEPGRYAAYRREAVIDGEATSVLTLAREG